MISAEKSGIFNQFLYTLIRADIDLKLPDEDIEDALEELDFDYISLFHQNALEWMKEYNLIDNSLEKLILLLRKKIDTMPKHLWNVESYKHSSEWQEIHKIAGQVLNFLGIEKRYVDSENFDINSYIRRSL